MKEIPIEEHDRQTTSLLITIEKEPSPMCYNSPGPRCAGHTRTLFRETKQALIEANANFEQAKQELADADDTQAQAKLINSEKLLKLAEANHAEATRNYDDSKADRAEKMEAFRAAKDAYFESAEGIQSLRDAGKTDEAEKYATIREMKLAELKRVEATKADIANGAIRAVIEQPVVKQAVPDLTGMTLSELKAMSEQESINAETLDAMLSVKMDNSFEPDRVKALVAGHEVTSAATLDVLSRAGDSFVRNVVAENANTRPETLARLAGDSVSDIRACVAGHPSTLPNTLRQLSTDPREDVRRVTAWNSNTPADALTRLAGDDNEYVAGAAVSNDNATHNMMRDAVSNHTGDWNAVNRALGGRDDVPADVLSTIAKNGGREALRNPALSVDTMQSLVTGGDYVHSSVAANPTLPVELMEVAKNQTGGRSHWLNSLASNPAAPADILTSIYSDDTRMSLATNPATPEFLYEKMAKSPDYKFRVELAKSETLPETVLLSLRYTDKSKQVRDATRVNRRYVQQQ